MDNGDDSLHPVFRQLLQSPADPAARPIEQRGIAELRAEFAADMRAVDGDSPAVHSVVDLEVADQDRELPVRIYRARPPSTARSPGILFIHGGGFIRGDIESHDSICRMLCRETDGVVVSVDYRRPPEAVFPAAVDDCYAALKWLLASTDELNIDPDAISIAGDSAGGTHAAAVALKSRDEGGPALNALVLYYPSVDHAEPGQWASQQQYGRGYWLDSAAFCIDQYLPDVADRRHAYASPYYAESLVGLPPTYICMAGFDPLRDQGIAFATALANADVEVEAECLENMLHGFVSCRGLVAEADEVLIRSAAFVRKAQEENSP